MNPVQRTVFMVVVLATSVGVHAYLARRLLAALPLSPARRRAAWAPVLASALVLPWIFQLVPYSGRPWADRLQQVGWTVWGLLAILLVLFLVLDLGRWLAGLARRGREEPPDPARRAFVARALNVAALVPTGLLGGAAWAGGRQRPVVERVRVPIAGLPDALRGFRIAQVSDLHVGATVREADMRALVDDVNALGADLVAVTGDLVDGPVEGLRAHVAPLRGLRARHGAWFVTGNHEYYSGALAWCAHCRDDLGWRVLLNEHAVLDHDGARVVLAGVTDHRAGRFLAAHASDPRRAIAGAPPADVRVLLAHQPQVADDAAALGFDLQLSGHTHGGQFFPFTVLIHLVMRFVAGLYRVGRMWLYVNRGATHWGPPFRLGAAREITLVELVRA